MTGPERAGSAGGRRRPSRASIVGAILAKDVRSYTRDKLWAALTLVGLAMFVAVFYLVPDSVDETITVGVAPATFAEALLAMQDEGAQEEGLDVVTFASAEELRAAVSGEREFEGERGDVSIGLAFPEDFLERAAAGERSTVEVYVDAGVPVEIRGAMSSAIREIAYAVQAAATGGDPEAAVPVTMPAEETIVLGEDRAGAQVSLRERFRPMLAYFVLMMESLALASLVAVEIQNRTVTALLVSPARVSDVLAAKSILGTVLAFGQALVLLALTRSFVGEWPVLVVAALLGAFIATGVALVSGSAGKDFVGTLFLGVVFLVPLAIPAFTALFPGTPPLWVRMLPTYGVFRSMMDSTAYGLSFRELGSELASATAWAVAVFLAGIAVLRRKVASL